MSLLNPNLQAFLEVVKTTTVHGAARELRMTQTGVTQRIRALEASLSTTLFTRSRKGMNLTHEGNALLRYCQAARDLEGITLAQISGAGVNSEVRISVCGPSSMMRSRVIPQCLPVLKAWSEVTIEFEINDLENREEGLKSGRTQLAILPRERVAKEMDSKILQPERYVLVGHKTWKKRPLEEIIQSERIIDFDPTDTMTASYLKKYKLLDRARSERHFVNNTESLVEMLCAGLGYGVLAEEFVDRFARRELALLHEGAHYENRLALAWYPRPQMPGYLAALIKAVR